MKSAATIRPRNQMAKSGGGGGCPHSAPLVAILLQRIWQMRMRVLSDKSRIWWSDLIRVAWKSCESCEVIFADFSLLETFRKLLFCGLKDGTLVVAQRRSSCLVIKRLWVWFLYSTGLLCFFSVFPPSPSISQPVSLWQLHANGKNGRHVNGCRQWWHSRLKLLNSGAYRHCMPTNNSLLLREDPEMNPTCHDACWLIWMKLYHVWLSSKPR